MLEDRAADTSTQGDVGRFYWSLHRTCLLPPQGGQRSGSLCRSSVKGGKKVQHCSDTSLCFCCTSEADEEWTACTSVHFSPTADGVECVPWQATFLQCNLTQCWRPLCVQSLQGDEVKGEFREHLKSLQWCRRFQPQKSKQNHKPRLVFL